MIDAGDFDGDNTRDLIGLKNDGTLWLYAGTGTVGPSGTGAYKPGTQIGSNEWGNLPSLIAGDFTGDRRAEVLGTRPDGSMSLSAGAQRAMVGSAWFTPPVGIASSAWANQGALVSSGDSNSDGFADYVARQSDGSLWFYQGNAAMTAFTSGYAPGVQVGSGWAAFETVTSTGDSSVGRTGDLLTMTLTGALLYYPATGNAGKLGPAYSASATAESAWNILG